MTNFLNCSIAFLTVIFLVAFSRTMTIDANESKYSVEVLKDNPVCYYPLEKSALKKEFVLLNESKAKKTGADGFFTEALPIVAGPSGLEVKAAVFDGNN
ncbi:MAG: hypothetical protein WCN64_00575, partial [Planctomycetota bacterium]